MTLTVAGDGSSSRSTATVGTGTTLFGDDRHVELEATWRAYQRMIAAYQHENRGHGRELMTKLIADPSNGLRRR